MGIMLDQLGILCYVHNYTLYRIILYLIYRVSYLTSLTLNQLPVFDKCTRCRLFTATHSRYTLFKIFKEVATAECLITLQRYCFKVFSRNKERKCVDDCMIEIYFSMLKYKYNVHAKSAITKTSLSMTRCIICARLWHVPRKAMGLRDPSNWLP